MIACHCIDPKVKFGLESLSSSQVSRAAALLDDELAAWRNRPLDPVCLIRTRIPLYGVCVVKWDWQDLSLCLDDPRGALLRARELAPQPCMRSGRLRPGP